MRSWKIIWLLRPKRSRGLYDMAEMRWTFCVQVFQITNYETLNCASLWMHNILKFLCINICKSFMLLKFQVCVNMIEGTLSMLKNLKKRVNIVLSIILPLRHACLGNTYFKKKKIICFNFLNTVPCAGSLLDINTHSEKSSTQSAVD